MPTLVVDPILNVQARNLIKVASICAQKQRLINDRKRSDFQILRTYANPRLPKPSKLIRGSHAPPENLPFAKNFQQTNQSFIWRDLFMHAARTMDLGESGPQLLLGRDYGNRNYFVGPPQP